jgi:hypothetical protein
VNLSLSTGVFPDEMKLALVTPLWKKPSMDPEILGNFRPISNLSFLSKLLERVVARQLIAYLERRSLLVPLQSTYRANHSTETALLKVLNDLLIALDEGKAVVLALLDQSAAFDTIDHAILLDRLTARFGITGCVLAWFKSYLFNRRQSVSVKGKSSRSVFLPFGVPQGSVLGPVLYTLYNSPLHEIASAHGISDHCYADDEQLYCSFRSTTESGEQRLAFSDLANCVRDTKEWASVNRLKFNDDKTDAMVISAKIIRRDSTTKIDPITMPLIVGEATIFPSTKIRNLGVILDSHLTMEPEISNIRRKAFYHLGRIAKIKKFLSRSALTQLIHAFVTSQLDYGNALLIGLLKKSLVSLQRVQNAAARVIVGIRKLDPVKPYLKTLHWLLIEKQIEFKIAVLTYRCLNCHAPKYLQDLLVLYRQDTNVCLRSSSTSVLRVPRTHTKTYGDRAFSVAATRIWNSHPVNIRSSSSITTFKSLLKTYYSQCHLYKLL